MLRTSLILAACWVSTVQAATPELTKIDRLIAQQLQVEQATVSLQQEAQQSLIDNQRLIALYQQEHKALTNALNRQQQQQDEVDQQRTELLAAQVEQEQQTELYEQQLAQGLQLVNALWQQLPPPVQQGLQDQSAQLANLQLGLSERYGTLIAILSRLEEFNSSINLHEDTLMHQGESWRVQQLFIGLAQGYYRLPDGSGVGIGHAINGQWQWRSAQKHQAEINQAFAIYQGKQPVEFVTLPLSAVAEATP
ncbi:DUF3450 family protein [Shewanella youngdeokensis]|uniref:DUF3450 family protein n=1 Tax=Shewanella youngdeokensis TaxID=2999068 RepID=A0ABZ0JZT7_9GAMM|nr:DUF3450 family protein [Shewanella sp. DAU334]